jgi:hypothetical protein
VSDTRLDIERDKFLEWKAKQREAIRNACEQCSEHNENCAYYDPEEESFDYEGCIRDSGGWE